MTSSTQPGPPQRLPVPAPTPARRRDRHGRGLRGPLLPPILPAWRTRAERFDELVTSAADEGELADLVRRVVVEQVALMLGRRPEEIDPDIP